MISHLTWPRAFPLALACLSLAAQAGAQVESEWARAIGTRSNFIPLENAALADGSALAVNWRTSSFPDPSATLEVVRFDPTGDVQWVQSLSCPNVQGEGFLSFDANASGQMATMHRGPQGPVLTCVSPSGVVESQTVLLDAGVSPRSGPQVSASGVVVTHVFVTAPPGTGNRLRRYDRSGTLLSEAQLGGSFNNTTQFSNAGLLDVIDEDATYVALRVPDNSVAVYRMDQDGDIAWEQRRQLTSMTPGPYNRIQAPSVNALGEVLVGTSESGSNFEARLLKYSPSGNLVYDIVATSFTTSFYKAVLSDTGEAYVERTSSSSQLGLTLIEPGGTVRWSRPYPGTRGGPFPIGGVDPNGRLIWPARFGVINSFRMGLASFDPETGDIVDRFVPLGTDTFDIIDAIDVSPSGFASISYRRSFPSGQVLEIGSYRMGSTISTSICTPMGPNSTGLTGQLAVEGSLDLNQNDVTLVGRRLPPGEFALLINSESVLPSPVSLPGGGGTLCLGGALGRHTGPGEIRQVEPGGRFALQIDVDALPRPTGLRQVMTGETWLFQLWHRDGATQGANTTEAVTVTF